MNDVDVFARDGVVHLRGVLDADWIERMRARDTPVPGDVVVHHARTVHGAFANASPDRRRRALSIRYAGDDARFRVKPGAPQKAHHTSLVEGAPRSEPACPRVWPAP